MQALCRGGCGFYGNPSTDGLCSLCYKEALKKKQTPPQTAPSPPSVTAQTMMETAIPTIPVLQIPPVSASPILPTDSKKDVICFYHPYYFFNTNILNLLKNRWTLDLHVPLMTAVLWTMVKKMTMMIKISLKRKTDVPCVAKKSVLQVLIKSKPIILIINIWNNSN